MAAHDYFDYFVDEDSVQFELDMQVAENSYIGHVSPGYICKSKHKQNKQKQKVVWSDNDDWEIVMAKAKKMAKKHGHAVIIRGERDAKMNHYGHNGESMCGRSGNRVSVIGEVECQQCIEMLIIDAELAKERATNDLAILYDMQSIN